MQKRIMKIAVIADDKLKEEWLQQGLADGVQVEWLQEVMAIPGTDCYIDLLFDATQKRIAALNQLQPAFVIVNSVTTVLTHQRGN
ncbi:MAG: hypothetical protein ABIT05_08855 [Chitinophagaceae bacterium]